MHSDEYLFKKIKYANYNHFYSLPIKILKATQKIDEFYLIYLHKSSHLQMNISIILTKWSSLQNPDMREIIS